MDLADVRDRVKATTLYASVEDAAALSEAFGAGLGRANAKAFVLISDESAEKNRLDGGVHRQRVNIRLSVVFAVKATAANKAARSDQIEAHKTAIKNALAGVKPTGFDTPLDYAASRPTISEGIIWTEMIFTGATTFTAA